MLGHESYSDIHVRQIPFRDSPGAVSVEDKVLYAAVLDVIIKEVTLSPAGIEDEP